jgi:hypothetical protein
MLRLVAGFSLLALLSGSLTASAQAPAPGEAQSFATRKQMHLTRMSTHIQILEQEQNCVQAATTTPALRSCIQAREAAVQAMMQQYRGLN